MSRVTGWSLSSACPVRASRRWCSTRSPLRRGTSSTRPSLYLRLGQSLSTLSGGECQRVKIAKELRQAEQPTKYVLDEPTTGLHMNDIDTLLHVLDSLVEQGHTVVVIEHNLDVIRQADWLIDLGPGPGRHGRTILFEGHVADYTDHKTPTCHALSHTESEADAHAV